MEIFLKWMEEIGEALPDLVSLVVCPGVLIAAALLLTILGKKGAYLPTAAGIGGAGAFLVACEAGVSAQLFGWLGLYVLLAALLRLLFLIPVGKKEEKEDLYEKFRVPLEEPEFPEEGEEETFAAEESGIRLAHAEELLSALNKCPLTAGDRLETDAVSRTIDGYRGRELNADEMRSLNDCLATVLKLTAKYKL